MWRAAVNAAALVDPGYAPVLAPRVTPGAAGVAPLEGPVAGYGAAAAHQLGGGAHHEAHQGRQPPSPALVHADWTKERIAIRGAAMVAAGDGGPDSFVDGVEFEMKVARR